MNQDVVERPRTSPYRRAMRRARRRVGLWGGLAGLLFAIWFRGRISPEGEHIAEWVIKLPEIEVYLFCFLCGYLSWTFLAKSLGGRNPLSTVLMAVFGSPVAFVLSYLIGCAYALPRLIFILDGDVAGGFWLWLFGVGMTWLGLVITLDHIGPIVWLIWPAGSLLALLGHAIMRRAKKRYAREQDV